MTVEDKTQTLRVISSILWHSGLKHECKIISEENMVEVFCGFGMEKLFSELRELLYDFEVDIFKLRKDYLGIKLL